MCITKIKPEIKKNIKSAVVPEYSMGLTIFPGSTSGCFSGNPNLPASWLVVQI